MLLECINPYQITLAVNAPTLHLNALLCALPTLKMKKYVQTMELVRQLLHVHLVILCWDAASRPHIMPMSTPIQLPLIQLPLMTNALVPVFKVKFRANVKTVVVPHAMLIVADSQLNEVKKNCKNQKYKHELYALA